MTHEDNVNNKHLPKPSALLILSPWLAVVCAVVLAGCVLIYDQVNGKREKDFAAQITFEKGQALINTLESAIQLGIGLEWAHNELEILLENSSGQKDVIILAVADKDGRIVSSGKPEFLERGLPGNISVRPLNPGNSFQWCITKWNSRSVFLVYKEFVPKAGPQNHKHKPDAHDGDEGHSQLSETSPLIIFVGYDISQIEEAEQTDRRHTVITVAILLFLALVGGLTCFLLRGYLSSRKLALETTAFSAEVLGTLPVGIMATDMENRISSANPEALKILGLSRETVAGLLISDILPSIWPMLDERLSEGKPVLEVETGCHFKEGQYVPLAVSASRIITDEGKLIGKVLILRDLGEIRDLQAGIRLRDRLAAIGTLAAGVAHEIKNPLSSIRGFAKYFQQSTKMDGANAKMAVTLEQEVMRLDKIVNDLLDYARPDILNIGGFILDDLLAKAKSIVQPDLDSRHIDFISELPEPSLVLTADKDKMTQVFINLFLNSIQAMKKSQEKRLVVAGRVVRHAKRMSAALLLEVTDTGCGISPDIIQDIFSPYFTTKARGAGLGLSIVHKIVEAHGGHIDVKSVAGRETSFIIHLPFHDLPEKI